MLSFFRPSMLHGAKMQLSICRPDDMLVRGLEMAGFDTVRQKRATRETNIKRFKAFYGSNPAVYSNIWEDLQTTTIPQAKIDPEKVGIDKLLSGIYFLKCYPTEEQRAGVLKICEKTARKWGWYFSQKIQALKEQKVCA